MTSTYKKQSILILLSTYNGEKYIEQQIESIMKQNVDAKILLRIRDDGSKDNTCKIIDKIIKKYPNEIELIMGENKGYNASFFELINSAHGYDYYSISDQDDVWMKDKLQIALNFLNEEKSCLPLLYASTSFLTEDDLIPYATTRKRKREFSIYNTIIQNICPGHTQVFNNELLKLIQGSIDTKRIYVYDSWICNIAQLYGKIVFDNESHTYYRQHRSNQLGYGKGLLGQIIMSTKHAIKGDGWKYREQIAYFSEKNKNKLVKMGFYDEIYKFLSANTLIRRLIFFISNKFYRQKGMETLAFRIAVLIGKY